MRVAIVDLGTNTCRLFLADVGEDGRIAAAERQTTVVRLGQGVDVNRRLHPEAIERTRLCLQEYAPRLEAYRPARRLLVATSVVRDASDGPAFLAALARDFGLPPRILAGEEEAALAFRGGTAGLVGRTPGPLVLTDIGGGSTEFAVGDPGRPPDHVCSLDIGAVRLTERFIRHDPPLSVEVGELRAFAAETIVRGVPAAVRGAPRAAVGVAGTYTTLAAYRLALRRYRPDLVHGYVLGLADIDAAIARFATLTSVGRGVLPGIQPGREDVILAGAVIAGEACRAFGLTEVRCSEADLLEGVALAVADGLLSASGAG
jgi:exopolyphosphatase/guanosine-5'-triphosphate,3'-diphosphate pyrophosphatase